MNSSRTDGDTFACGNCGSPLDVHVELPAGVISFEHPAWKSTDHPPEPVPADSVEATYVCDFCTDPRILFVYHTERAVFAKVETVNGTVVRNYGTRWSACIECAVLVEPRDLQGLVDRITAHKRALSTEVIAHLAVMLDQVLASLVPGRALAVGGQWAIDPLPARTLPKIRDRLASLIGGETALPFGLSHPNVRRPLAASLAGTRLFWIDNDFTELTRNAAEVMPRMRYAPGDLPAAHGFVAWTRPVDAHRSCIAASWGTYGDAVQLVGYRSVGSGLPPARLQLLRTEVGWLIPVFAVALRPGQLVTAVHPAAALLTTWRLIRQRLAETATTRADTSIRKSYQRARRPEPTIQLVSIRGARTTSTSAQRAASGNSNNRDYRWWVAPHWRHQPHGPGRMLRDWIVVRPHLRGPQDKPIRTTTTVRVLGKLPPRPEITEQTTNAG
ncbi:hypothetical protein JIG36_48750 [Actinoplanes sp. LDG1-06]|uniref:Uncharacterized protein n=1 Tax=Paractinoplanes ovalisporus TaxID=2810368 RepID=A0ABS2AU77_9ACTN|nr:hypothetical protein [Actinoplanes ovalisporus]MBM2623412.1 hypothetical protein [Actinoplanes ovalisporus]